MNFCCSWELYALVYANIKSHFRVIAVVNMSFKTMLNLFLALLLLLGTPPVFAAPAGSMAKPLNLAMLDISTLDPQIHQHLNNTQGKQHATKPVEKLPDNCLTWNVQQLNRKARAFSEPIQKYARQYKVDHNLIKSVITAESCFKTKALSHADARGLMQLIPDTARRFGVKDSYDPDQNIRGGVKYLRFLLDRFKGDLKKVVAAYNAGEGKVEKFKGIPPYKETQQYVKNVLATYDKLRAPALLAARLKRQKAASITASKQGSVSRIRQKIKNKAVYRPPRLGGKPGRGGWRYNRARAPHLFKH